MTLLFLPYSSVARLCAGARGQKNNAGKNYRREISKMKTAKEEAKAPDAGVLRKLISRCVITVSSLAGMVSFKMIRESGQKSKWDYVQTIPRILRGRLDNQSIRFGETSN
jgi:hypothetical protein